VTARRPSADRQTELVDAALQIIATQGIAALSTRSLATEVGLSSGAIFRHFPSLAALLEAVVARVERVLDATFPPDALAPLERLAQVAQARASAVGGQRGILRLMLSEQFALALPAGGSDRLAACVRKTRGFVERCLGEAQASGHVRRDVPAVRLAPIVMGTVQMLALAPGNPRQRERDRERRAVIDGLLTLLGAPRAARSTHRRTP
jgi:AcrR family transcriptional regulator